MSPSSPAPRASDRLACYYRSGDALRSRSVGAVVLSAQLAVPAPSPGLTADWDREIAQRLGLEPGDVEPLPLARARARWPDYRRCVQAQSDWTDSLGLPGLLANCDVALMACRGAKYHHDAAHYGGMAFCNLFLSEDRGLDLHFPAMGQRIALRRGTAVVFDTGQPHAVIERRGNGFSAADFPSEQQRNQVFLSWELPIEQAGVAQALGIDFDIDPATALLLDEEQLWRGGARVNLCPTSGRWQAG
jgi:hypothetical protein